MRLLKKLTTYWTELWEDTDRIGKFILSEKALNEMRNDVLNEAAIKCAILRDSYFAKVGVSNEFHDSFRFSCLAEASENCRLEITSLKRDLSDS